MILRKLVCVATLSVACGYSTLAVANRSYVVGQGDTLWEISKSYGCDPGTLRQSNALEGDRLNIGQKLEIPPCQEALNPIDAEQPAPVPPPTSQYVIVAGDTLGGIAARFDTSVAELVARNRLTSTLIRPGQSLELSPGASAAPTFVLGQSVGLPHHGRLIDAARLKQAPGYFIRRPHRAYGARHVVDQVAGIVSAVRQRFPNAHRLAIGDISAVTGGKISMHASHQSGRDIDLGFYFKKRPEGYPEEFVVATAKNLDFEATWSLLTSFTDLADAEAGVEKIFLNYKTQRLLYKLARKHGIGKDKLGEIFQYPRGRSSSQGIVRHCHGHDEHLHVRFKCPPGDEKCR